MENVTNTTMNYARGNNYRNHSARTMTENSCNRSMHCHNTGNDEFPIGMTYVPWQSWKNIYEPDKALQRGTIFEELDKPFLGMQGVKR